MAKRIRFCPKCMNIIHKNDVVCSSCGLAVSEMQELKNEQAKKNFKIAEEQLNKAETVSEETEQAVVSDAQNEESESANENTNEVNEETTKKSKRHKHKPKQIRKEDLPEYTVDENGEYNINTKDVTFLEDIDYKSYSAKQARGEKPAREKIEWWEIYKWADLMLARRKINKEVKKASYKMPYGVTRTGMLLWCIFLGWFGAHDFYAQNKKRGWTCIAFNIIVAIVINVPVLYKIMGIFVGGGLGFCLVVMWLGDLIAILMNRYQYRISKEEFISNMNVATRGKLAKRYWKLDRPTFLAKEQARINKIVDKKNKKKQKKLKRLKKITGVEETQNKPENNGENNE